MFRDCFAFTAAALMASSAAPAIAQAPAPSQAPSPQPSGADPNEIVCERQEVLGSRLAKKKVCMTRAQWADQKLQDRQDLERAQVQRSTKGGQ